MKFIIYSIVVMFITLIHKNDLHAMEYAMEKAAKSPVVAAAGQPAKPQIVFTPAPAPIHHAQPKAPTTIDMAVTLITLFDFPNDGSCSNFKTVQSKQLRNFKMNPDTTLEEHMELLQKTFDSFYPLSFSKDGSAPIALATKVGTLGTSIFAHKYKKLPRPPKPGEGEE